MHGSLKSPKICFFLSLVLAATSVAPPASAQSKKKAEPKYDASVAKPTVSEIRYGEHERHILDFWQAKSDTPTPLVFVIHGGGWQGGSKERVNRFADVQK